MADPDRAELTQVQRDVVDEIRRLHALGAPLNLAAVKRQHPELVAAAFEVQPFWGWKRALEAAGVEYAKIRVELLEEVECRLCGHRAPLLTAHLYHHHQVAWKDYQADYPDAESTSERLRAEQMGRQRATGERAKALLPHWEPIWSAEYVLDRMAELARLGHELSLENITRDETTLRWAAKRFHGGWDQALIKIGIDPKLVRRNQAAVHWTRESVIAEIQRRHFAGEPLNVAALDRTPLYYGAVKFFGRVTRALRAAGIDPKAVQRRNPEYTKRQRELFLDEVRRVAALPRADWLPALQRLRKRFGALVPVYGSWAQVAEAAGVPAQSVALPRGGRRYRNELDVVAELRARATARRPIDHDGLAGGTDPDLALLRSALRLFGDLGAALRSANVEAPRTTALTHVNAPGARGGPTIDGPPTEAADEHRAEARAHDAIGTVGSPDEAVQQAGIVELRPSRPPARIFKGSRDREVEAGCRLSGPVGGASPPLPEALRQQIVDLVTEAWPDITRPQPLSERAQVFERIALRAGLVLARQDHAKAAKLFGMSLAELTERLRSAGV